MKGFIDFIRKGNLVQIAVAFVMGIAFAAVVLSFVTNLISPLLGLFGGVDFSEKSYCMSGPCETTVDAATGVVTTTGVLLSWGAFVTAVITFLVTALVIYFLVVKPYERLEERLSKGEDEDVAPTEIDLLTEIRDSLQSQGGTPHAGADISKP
jgi:large conductance mechanosensitive channel